MGLLDHFSPSLLHFSAYYSALQKSKAFEAQPCNFHNQLVPASKSRSLNAQYFCVLQTYHTPVQPFFLYPAASFPNVQRKGYVPQCLGNTCPWIVLLELIQKANPAVVNSSQTVPFWPLLLVCTNRAHLKCLHCAAQQEGVPLAGSAWQLVAPKNMKSTLDFTQHHSAAHAAHALAISYDHDGKLQLVTNEHVYFKVPLDSSFTM